MAQTSLSNLPSTASDAGHSQFAMPQVSAVLTVLTYAVIAAVPFSAALDLDISFTILVALVTLQLIRILTSKINSSLPFIVSISFLFLFSFPSLSLTYSEGVNALPVVALFTIYSDVFLFAARKITKYNVKHAISSLQNSHISDNYYPFLAPILFLLTLSSFSALVIPEQILDTLITVHVPFFIAVALLEEMLIRNPSRGAIYAALIGFLLTVAFHAYFYWNGGGRLILASYLLIPFAICTYYRDIGIKFWHIFALAPSLFFIAQISRYGEVESTAELFSGSASHHLLLSQSLITSGTPIPDAGVGPFLEQFSLLFLNWVPRGWWADKPVGLGLSSVDDWLGRQGFGEGFSVSIGMFGEQIYLLGNWFVVGIVIIAVTLMLMRLGLAKMIPDRVGQLVIFDVALMSYFWGGCATFGSRFWFIVVPALASIWLLRRLISGRADRRSWA